MDNSLLNKYKFFLFVLVVCGWIFLEWNLVNLDIEFYLKNLLELYWFVNM